MNANEQENGVWAGTGMMQPGVDQVAHAGPLQILVRRRWQLLACLLLVSSMAFAVTVLRKPQYEATARVQVVPQEAEATGMAALLGGKSDDFAAQCELLDSRRALVRAIERLNMGGFPWGYDEEGIRQLRKQVDISPMSKSRMIDIVGVGRTGTEASAVANNMMAAFIETSAETRAVNDKRMIERLQNQVRIYQNEIEVQEEAINRFREQNLITGDGAGLLIVKGRIGALEGELTAVQMRRLQLKERQGKLERLIAGPVTASIADIAIPEISQDSELTACNQQLQQLRQERIALQQAYLPGHRKVLSIDSQIAGVADRLGQRATELLKSHYDHTKEQYAGLKTREGQVQKLLNEQKELSVATTGRLQDYQKLTHKLNLMHTFQTECIKQIRHFNIKAEVHGPPVRVVEAASVPSRPAGLSKRQQAGSILVLGLLLSLIFVLALDRWGLNQDVSTQTNWGGMYMPMGATSVPGGWPMYWPSGAGTETSAPERVSPAPVTNRPVVLGQLGQMSLGGHSDAAFIARCQVSKSAATSPEASTFREISANLLGRFGTSRQSIVVTGSEVGCGKTTCACNLALALAQSGRSVCLVESNPDDATLHRIFDDDGQGSAVDDVLATPERWDELTRETDILNLVVAHCWAERSATEAVDSGMLTELSQHLINHYDWVVYDGGSVYSEFTPKLLGAIGKAMFVTPGRDPALEQATAQQVERCGAVVLGCIENNMYTAAATGKSRHTGETKSQL